jgi:hypothetical protein
VFFFKFTNETIISQRAARNANDFIYTGIRLPALIVDAKRI